MQLTLEWCADDWQPTSRSSRRRRPYRSSQPSPDAAGKGAPKDGVLRSGSWKDKPEQLGSGSRRRADVTLRDDAVGLRCILSKTGN
jgi:formylglycine-generating enzyme required for sulfatase activity